MRRLRARPCGVSLLATGRVSSVSRIQIGAEITAVVLERRVQEGDVVSRGDVLLVLRADDIRAQVRQAETLLTQLESTTRPQARVELDRAESALEEVSVETDRRRRLAERSLLSDEELEQAAHAEQLARFAMETARLKVESLAAGGTEESILREQLSALQAQLAKTIVRSQITGTVLTRDVEPGDLIQPGRVLFTLALEGDTEIRLPVDERNLSLLKIGQPATVVADAYPANPFTARVRVIAPSIDPQRGTVQIYLSVEPVPDYLREDMTVSVSVETGRRAQAIAVPNDALGGVLGNRAQVLAVRQGKLQKLSVVLGLRGLVMSEVVSGLEDGDRVLANPSLALEDAARVRFSAQPLPVAVEARTGDHESRYETPVDSSDA